MNTKKFFTILFLAFSTIVKSGYVPTQGQLELSDTRPYACYAGTLSIKRGVIMDTLLTDAKFTKELGTIKSFLGIPQSSTYLDITYQELMDKLATTINSQAIAVIEALERVIMHQYHYRAYITYSYNKTGSIFITGIQYPVNFTNKLNPVFNQIMQELENLSYIASHHRILAQLRIKAIIHSYRNWKRNMLITAAATAIGCTSAYLYLKK